MVTCFEHLPNELLLDIFHYIDPRYTYATFWNLNARLNELVNSVSGLQLIIDEQENKELLAAIAPHIGLLQVNTWDDIDLQGFCNLYSLILTRPSPMQLRQIRADTMSNLSYLSLYTNVNFTLPKELILDVFSSRFLSLRWARLGHIDSNVFNGFQSTSLCYLHISCYDASTIQFVLMSCPSLKKLHVDFLQQGDTNKHEPVMIKTHPLQHLILRDYCCLLSHNDIRKLVTSIPTVTKIELKFECNTSFLSLIQYLGNYLRDLRQFQCCVTEFPIDSTTSLETMQYFHSCFSSIKCRTHESKFRVFQTQQ